MSSSRLRGLCLVFLGLAIGCASPRAPTGGDKDITPPRIISEESTPNHQTNFSEKEITITFDEWVTLKDVLSQLVISPLMPEPPEVKLKGKSVMVELPDSLREETTYTINFGSAIADLNEGNVLENFSFVFSTGPVLDSVSVFGRLMDAVTLMPASDVLVMLHPANADSAIYTTKPDYLVRSDKEGRWRLENIRRDTFAVMALADENLNFLYDLETESFGWLDEVMVTDKPKIILPDIMIFPKEIQPVVKDVIQPTQGWVKVVLKGSKPWPVPTFNPPIADAVTAWEADTFNVWFPASDFYEGYVLVPGDTMDIQAPRDVTTTPVSIFMQNNSGKLAPHKSARLYTPIPVKAIDTSFLLMRTDSMEKIQFDLSVENDDARYLILNAPWKSHTRYTMVATPGAVSNVLGNVVDTLRTIIQVVDSDEFGDLSITVNGLEDQKEYLMRLLLSGREIATHAIRQDTMFETIHKTLLPGKYQVEIIEDLNGNGLWDTGDFALRRQPERKMIFDLESLRAAWEVKSIITWQP